MPCRQLAPVRCQPQGRLAPAHRASPRGPTRAARASRASVARDNDWSQTRLVVRGRARGTQQIMPARHHNSNKAQKSAAATSASTDLCGERVGQQLA
eukprot:1328928-Prymnesium_polylepis.1